MRFKWTERLLPFESVSEKLKWFPLAENKIFLNIGLNLMAIMVSKEI